MSRDVERTDRVRDALRREKLDALVCGLPENVRLLTGYWPVVGTSIAVFRRDGRVMLVVPEDEQKLASKGWQDDLVTFSGASLDRLTTASKEIVDPLTAVCKKMQLQSCRVGYEAGANFEPASYASSHLFNASLLELLLRAFPSCELQNATPILARLRSVLSRAELATLRSACTIAHQAFVEGALEIRPGMRETEVAAKFRAPLSTKGVGFHHVDRADGFCYCMSGANAADASASYAITRARELAQGDLVLVHCNSYADGLWTDITRTYSLGEPNERARNAYRAVFAAREAALAAIAPGVTGADVDRAVRSVLREHGFDREFRHGTGHGVGFAAINHAALPRIHPASTDVLESGMVFNVEPAIYVDGWGGIRHCDVVVVTRGGAELLTAFQANEESLTLRTS